MTRIDRPLPPRDDARDRAALTDIPLDGKGSGRRDPAGTDTAAGGARGGRDLGTGADVFGRGRAFERHLRHGPREDRRPGDDGPDRDGDPALLAGLPRPAESLLPPRPVAAPERAEPAVRERVLALIERVDRAIGGDLHVDAHRPVAVELAVGDLVPGLRGLRITMDANGLDIVLERTGTPADEGVAAAARELAERLQLRFPTRTVRVAERVADASATDAADDAAPTVPGVRRDR